MLTKIKKIISGGEHGCFDGLQGDVLKGWLKLKTGQASSYQLVANGHVVAEGLADEYRSDLHKMGNHGKLAFTLPASQLLENESLYFAQNILVQLKAPISAIVNAKIEISSAQLKTQFPIVKGESLHQLKLLIQQSGLWDEAFYRCQYLKDEDKFDALEHYLAFGCKKGFSPSPWFSDSYYHIHNPDIASLAMPALYHYITIGEKEGREPNDFFSPKRYLEKNPELEHSDECLLAHYIQHGQDTKLSSGPRLMPSAVTSSLLNKNELYVGYFELAKYDFYDAEPIASTKVNSAKVIAYYLPQFHPFEQNDRWWGKGFTEWTNVSKARPLLANHEQPKLPADLGFYDLRLKQTLLEQAKLAKQAGVEAFCLYYYWFNGTVLMDTPLELIFNNPDIDIEYCLCWANENWTRTWDGQADNVLIEQSYSPEDDIAFIKKISPYFTDSRYVKVDGKPLLIVYRALHLPDMKATIIRWRKWCQNNNIGDIQVVMVQSDKTDPREYGFDAAVEFPPHRVCGENLRPYMNFEASYHGIIHDYCEMINHSLNKQEGDYKYYKGVTLSWDNTARRKKQGSFFTNANPQRVSRWLAGINHTYRQENRPASEQLIFVNAWNEWAEGTYLEPDQLHGHAYLNAVANFNSGLASIANIAAVVHIFYLDLLDEIIENLKAIEDAFDLFVTCTPDVFQQVSVSLNEAFSDSVVDIKIVPNRGRDIAPFLCNHIASLSRYDYVCKIHSKKSLHAGGINNWRGFIYERLLGKPEQVQYCLDELKNNDDLGLIYPEYSEAIKPFIEWGSNKNACADLLAKFNINAPDELPDFPAGSMFWFKPKALSPLLKQAWSIDDFPEEQGQVDATIMHAVERSLALIVESSGYRCKQIKLLSCQK